MGYSSNVQAANVTIGSIQDKLIQLLFKLNVQDNKNTRQKPKTSRSKNNRGVNDPQPAADSGEETEAESTIFLELDEPNLVHPNQSVPTVSVFNASIRCSSHIIRTNKTQNRHPEFPSRAWFGREEGRRKHAAEEDEITNTNLPAKKPCQAIDRLREIDAECQPQASRKSSLESYQTSASPCVSGEGSPPSTVSTQLVDSDVRRNMPYQNMSRNQSITSKRSSIPSSFHGRRSLQSPVGRRTGRIVPGQLSRQHNEESLTPPRMIMRYEVILSRNPLTVKQWKPEGKFMDMSFDTLLQELPIPDPDDVTALVLGLEGPNMKQMKSVVDRGDDDELYAIKQSFNRHIKSCLAGRSAQPNPFVFFFEIEPIAGDGQQDAADEELYW